jgi:hypothetical protein
MKILLFSLLAYLAVNINTQQETFDYDSTLCWNETSDGIITIYAENASNDTLVQYWLSNNFSISEANTTFEIISYDFNVCTTFLIGFCNDTSALIVLNELNTTSSLIGNKCEIGNETIIENQTPFQTFISLFNDSDIVCTVKCRNDSMCEANGTLSWFTSLNTEIYNETLLFGLNDKEKKSILPDEIWLQYLNKHIYCSFAGENDTAHSGKYYLGLVIEVNNSTIENSQNIDLTLREDEIKGLKIYSYSNVPLKCKENTTDCEIKLFVEPNDEYFSIESQNKCFSSLNSKNAIAYFTIRPGVYIENVFLESRKIPVLIKAISFGLINNLTFSLPPLQIRYIPQNRPFYRGGSCYNDPHCTTNDGLPFEFQYFDGEYLMYENKELQFRVHLVSHPCVPGCEWCNYCIKEIYIQSIDDLVGFDIESTPKLFYRDLSGTKVALPLIWSNNQASLPKETLFSIYQDSYQYNIFSHYGTAVRIAKQGYFFQITPSKLDFVKVNGVFGNYNSKREDDFGNFKNMTEFFMNFNVDSKNLPKLSDGQYYNFTKQKNEQKYCSCILKEDGNFEENCENGPMKTKKTLKPSGQGTPVRSKRTIIDQSGISNQDLLDVLKFNKSNFETQVPLVQSNVSNCNIISNDSILKECGQKGVINVTKLVEDCEIDFKSTNLTIWAEYYVKTRRGWCKTSKSL